MKESVTKEHKVTIYVQGRQQAIILFFLVHLNTYSQKPGKKHKNRIKLRNVVESINKIKRT